MYSCVLSRSYTNIKNAVYFIQCVALTGIFVVFLYIQDYLIQVQFMDYIKKIFTYTVNKLKDKTGPLAQTTVTKITIVLATIYRWMFLADSDLNGGTRHAWTVRDVNIRVMYCLEKKKTTTKTLVLFCLEP